MAKVSLRSYNREIERLVEQGQNDEAIAHCRHILKTFPKHLETYKLLGKAYLEARRYAEAVDIFGRLLMAVPDDFVAHVGLSIIRDEEGKLDDAIWHMERAFEVQSSNAAIQSELQRLYGRRDGMEPPKIRMTRGALARIYVVGELYPQAIAEIRGVLTEDPQRVDMQVLLAYSYFKSGQRSDATDICNQLLKRYAYTYEANRILIDLLPATTGTVESTQVYRMRISEMDPYSNFAKGSIFETDNVPDASVSLDRLEYTGEEVQMGQDWNNASLGYSSVPPLGEGAAFVEERPEWLRSGMEETPHASALPVSQPQAGEEIPDFLKQAGWAQASRPETPSSIFDEEPAEGIVQADIPDWLRSQAPSNDDVSKPTEPVAAIETPDFLSQLDASYDPFSGASPPVGETPDWLKGLGGEASVPSIETSPAQPLDSSADVPDWLKAANKPGQDAGVREVETPDWPAGLGGLAASSAAPAADIPDWLQSIEPKSQPDAETPAAPAESLGASAQEQDDAIAWLESLAAKHGAKPEELVTDPNKRSETPPGWVAQVQTIGAQPAAETPAAPTMESLGSSSQEQDDAIAWLESLAAKHGAKPEELVTDPNKRSETPPEWVAQAQTIGAQTPAEPEPVKPEWSETAANVGKEFFAEFEKASEQQSSTGDETGAWLRDLEKEEKPAYDSGKDLPDWMKPQDERPLERGAIPEWLSETEPPKRNEASLNTASLPDWLGGLESSGSAVEPEEALVKNQDLSEWLSGLDDEPGLDIDPDTLRAPHISPEAKQALGVQPAETLPDWMTDGSEEVEEQEWTPPASSETAPVFVSADLPEWLRSVDEEKTEEGYTGDDLPPWEHREQWEAEGGVVTPPKPTAPSDWQPIAAGSQPKASSQPREREKERLVQSLPTPEPSAPAAKKASVKQGLPRARKSESQSGVNLLGTAKAELERGDIPEALMHYGKLIKKGRHLEEVIGHLTESLYRYPVEVSIWQALGDAYMRANRLKEALEAYNKAEELIR
ncbi:MAG: tetratricopeptide repeat protein [Chloroflexi bacterium]|nr:tetratricopeptide repeat protein [Chloroflexota bacterium]